mmetsp:Transcript_11242/g.9551  ORF Transcript_11242/g.9551 Transcript_11242/m.9551 type:complete len:101 (-) Transcript_11242:7-309(-)
MVPTTLHFIRLVLPPKPALAHPVKVTVILKEKTSLLRDEGSINHISIEQESGEASLNKWLLYGPQGVDSTNGANYTALYQTGVAPDAWVLYTDANNENPL